MARGKVYTDAVRDHTIQFWESFQFLKSQQAEWTAQDYANTLEVGADNADVTVVQVGAVVFDTVAAVQTVMDAGHATNVTNLLK